jgi:fructokinase
MAGAILCLGEALVDLVAEEVGVDLTAARTFVKTPGGAIANVAVGLARLGVSVRFAGQVGADAFGLFLREYLAGQGVDLRLLRLSPDYPTGVVLVARDRDCSPSFCFLGNPSADMMYGEEEIGEEMLAGVSFAHLGTVTMVREESRAASFKLMRLAAGLGVRLSFDPNLRLHLWRDHALLRRLALEVVGGSDLVKLSVEELRFLSGCERVEAGAARLREQGATLVVTTLGAEGAYYLGPGLEGRVAGFRVQAVDATGAGDAFAAGLLSRLRLLAWPPPEPELREALAAANAAGALAAMAVGATAGLPRPEELAEFLQRRPSPS